MLFQPSKFGRAGTPAATNDGGDRRPCRPIKLPIGTSIGTRISIPFVIEFALRIGDGLFTSHPNLGEIGFQSGHFISMRYVPAFGAQIVK
jgi:hypothetical protein